MDSDTIYRNALALEDQGNHGDALALYEALTTDSSDPRYHVAHGVCLQRLGRWNESVAALTRGVELRPHYCLGDARLFLADSFLKCGRRQDAIAQWKIVAAMEPGYPSYEKVPDDAKRMLELHGA